MWRERKEKKRGERKSIPLNLDLDLLWEDLGIRLVEIIENYKRKGYVLWELWTFENFVLDLVFWSYFLYLRIFESTTLGFYRS
jgi:hypothetical protein